MHTHTHPHAPRLPPSSPHSPISLPLLSSRLHPLQSHITLNPLTHTHTHTHTHRHTHRHTHTHTHTPQPHNTPHTHTDTPTQSHTRAWHISVCELTAAAEAVLSDRAFSTSLRVSSPAFFFSFLA